MPRFSKQTVPAFILLCCIARVQADPLTTPSANDKSPSKDQILWTRANVADDFSFEYSGVAPSSIGFGDGRDGRVTEYYTDIREIITRRELLAFLLHGGVEWQRMGFSAPNRLLVPDELDAVTAYLATDFRWSDKSMMRIQMQPGFYTDMQDVDAQDFNIPLAIAYTRVVSNKFQWAFGLSINTLRDKRYLPGGGFRWQINDRWKLKFMLPTPQVEYKANDVVHLWIGSDFRGDTYRVNRHFGDDRGNPVLNNALVDYQEIRSGTGFSWNIKPLIELNGEVGYMMARQFDFHNNGVSATGKPAPYISLNIHILYEINKDERPMTAQLRSMQIEFPRLNQLFQIPK